MWRNRTLLIPCWWECKMVELLCRTVWHFLKRLNVELLYDPEIPLLFQGKWKHKSYTQMILIALLIIIHSSQKVATTPMSITWWMGNYKGELHTNGVLFRKEKEWSIDICYCMSEPWKRYSKWKKPDTEDHIWFHWNVTSRIGRSVERVPYFSGCKMHRTIRRSQVLEGENRGKKPCSTPAPPPEAR